MFSRFVATLKYCDIHEGQVLAAYPLGSLIFSSFGSNFQCPRFPNRKLNILMNNVTLIQYGYHGYMDISA